MGVSRYSEEFRESAVQLVLEKGKSVQQVAKELGVHVKTLKDWVEWHEKSQRGDALRIQELEREVKQLKKKLCESQEAVDILKKNDSYTQQTVKEQYQVVKRLKNAYPVSRLCQVMDVTRSGFYAFVSHEFAVCSSSRRR
ncbi:hypothetical protein FACS1894184_15130 [Clostridia bacterium]|nr:hypothetical protein FACS1894184_15130 [Clostridia bacterium]